MEEAFEATAKSAGNALAAIFAYVADRALFLSNRTPHARSRSRQQRRMLMRHLDRLGQALEQEEQGDQLQTASEQQTPGK